MNRFCHTLKTLFVSCCLVSLAASRVLAVPGAETEKPNIVIILVDDMGWTDLACFGSRYFETPNIDNLPTICAATGVQPPPDRPIDGKSLLPVLLGSDGLDREELFWHFPHYRAGPPYSIIRSGDWKLIRRYGGPQPELYNIKDDLSETTDLAAKMPEKVEQLEVRLSRWLEDTGARLPKANPKWKK